MYLTRTTVIVSLATPPLEEITRTPLLVGTRPMMSMSFSSDNTTSRHVTNKIINRLTTCIHVDKKEIMIAGRLRRNVVQIARTDCCCLQSCNAREITGTVLSRAFVAVQKACPVNHIHSWRMVRSPWSD
ncbi:hypothetical protein PISMIDRAFT_500924 [Pisolithus microcarpus 441]|uniref:Uncharacterized protein n=1 Tax=Pisolithus microcarpus 441 TaxID=765257 RepID=A0A0C9Z0A6_9AGAM|nr:hypothetical protein PISMIDRAFT_500924 [Pisolithus microcarpus 441]